MILLYQIHNQLLNDTFIDTLYFSLHTLFFYNLIVSDTLLSTKRKHLINMKSSTIAYLSFKANNISFFQNHRLNIDTLMIQKPVNIKEISDTFRKIIISMHQ